MFCLCGGLLPAGQAGTKPARDFQTLHAQAAAAREAERLDEALDLYRRATALKPSWAEGWWYIGTILYDRNRYSEAAEAFRKAAALTPKDGTSDVMLGLCERELGQDGQALLHIQAGNAKGISGDAQFRQVVLFSEAALLQSMGKFENAQQRLYALCLGGAQAREVTKTLGMTVLRITGKGPPPGSPEAAVTQQVGEAQCLAGQKKYEDARLRYSSVVSRYPDFPNIHYAYGRFLIEAGDAAAGIDELKGEIAANPSHVIARLQIAAAHYKTDSAAGLRYAEEAVKIDPRIPMGHYLLGLLLLDTGDAVRAIPELEAARKSFPLEAKVYLALGSAYARAGREQDAARARMEFQKLSKEKQESDLIDPQ